MDMIEDLLDSARSSSESTIKVSYALYLMRPPLESNVIKLWSTHEAEVESSHCTDMLVNKTRLTYIWLGDQGIDNLVSLICGLGLFCCFRWRRNLQLSPVWVLSLLSHRRRNNRQYLGGGSGCPPQRVIKKRIGVLVISTILLHSLTRSAGSTLSYSAQRHGREKNDSIKEREIEKCSPFTSHCSTF